MDKEQLMDKLEIEIHDLIVKFEKETSVYVSEVSINRGKETGEIESIDIITSRYL